MFNSHTPHTGRVGCLHSMFGIFDDDTMSWLHTQLFG